MSLIAIFRGRMSPLERILLALGGVFVLSNLVLPIWRVYLRAPQYPEGLHMDIFARSLAGDIQNINILNHYVGMKPLSVDVFSEFRWMTPTLGALGLTILLAGLWGKRWGGACGWLALYAFDGFMLWDLFRWMYDWGHDLDPRAAMSLPPFTPPVLGFEQVANFTIFSFPSFGGSLIVVASLMGLYALWHAARSSP